jgi:GWxTD domain-containing protein
MVATIGSRLLPFALVLLLVEPTLPELFQKAKQEFKLASYGNALSTLEKLETESAKPGFERDRQALLPGLLFYKGAALAALGKQAEAQETFVAFLVLKPDVQLDPAMYPKSVIAALESARKQAAKAPETRYAEASGLMVQAYRAFVPPAGHADESMKEDWSDGPVRWLLTSEEKKHFSEIVNPINRSEFIADFWKVRDPRPDTPENEYREEFDKRVAFADVRFTQDEMRGSLTDRGMVFILMGPPTYSGKKMMETGDDSADSSGLSRYSPGEIKMAGGGGGGSSTSRLALGEKVNGPGTKIKDASNNTIEAWHYLRENLPREIPYQELQFQFVTKQGYGHNVLQRDSNALAALERSKRLPVRS